MYEKGGGKGREGGEERGEMQRSKEGKEDEKRKAGLAASEKIFFSILESSMKTNVDIQINCFMYSKWLL